MLPTMPWPSLNVADATTTDGLATGSVVFAAIGGASKLENAWQEVFQSNLSFHVLLWVVALFAGGCGGVKMLWAAAALTSEMPAKDAMAADTMGFETFALLTPKADAEEAREGKQRDVKRSAMKLVLPVFLKNIHQLQLQPTTLKLSFAIGGQGRCIPQYDGHWLIHVFLDLEVVASPSGYNGLRENSRLS